MQLKEVLELANAAKFMTISTIGEGGRPNAVTVEFGLYGEKIVFDTFNNSRKFANMQKDDRVALVIMPNEDTSVDIEGQAELLKGEELVAAQEAYFVKIPEARKWANLPNVSFFVVSVGWARCTDVSVSPWKIDVVGAA